MRVCCPSGRYPDIDSLIIALIAAVMRFDQLPVASGVCVRTSSIPLVALCCCFHTGFDCRTPPDGAITSCVGETGAGGGSTPGDSEAAAEASREAEEQKRRELAYAQVSPATPDALTSSRDSQSIGETFRGGHGNLEPLHSAFPCPARNVSAVAPVSTMDDWHALRRMPGLDGQDG